MISIGVDVAKGKSMFCFMRSDESILAGPFVVQHTESDLNKVSDMIAYINDECRIIMEATGAYHLPMLTFFKEKGYFVAVINPLEMKQFLREQQGLRKVKTDKSDAKHIARYGQRNWYWLRDYKMSDDKYSELRLLGRQYRHYMKQRVDSLLSLTHLLDGTMPGIKNILRGWNERNGKDKLSDFVKDYWHYDNITSMSEEAFVASYEEWTKNKGYRPSQAKARQIYAKAKDSIPTIPSSTPSTKMLMQEAVSVLKTIDHTLMVILTQMKEIAKSLPEYNVVREMGGVGEVLAVKLIAEIGDVRRFYSGKALVAYAGIDVPPYQSGKYSGSERHISKRGSSNLRKITYEVMRSLVSHAEPEDHAVYRYIQKKEQEGKAKKAAKVAGMNKFLRIYYARVMEVYNK